MSARAEILAVLAEHPEGLTSKEIAAFCPGLEYCEITVGRTIAVMKSDDVIHSNGLRDTRPIYFPGKKPVAAGEAREERVPFHGDPARTSISNAALAIAAMRSPKTAAGQASAEPDKTRTAQPRSAAPVPAAAHEEEPMSLADRIIAALKKHGPMDTRTLGKHIKNEKNLATICAQLVKGKRLGKLGGGPRSTIYGLPTQKAPEAKLRLDAPPPHLHNGKKKKPARRIAAAAPTEPAPPALNGEHAQFAINEQGELGVEKDGAKLKLDKAEFHRLREFITRTQPVWEGAEA